MKKTLLLIFSMVSLTLLGNLRTKTISITFNANDFQLIQEDSCTIISSNVHDLFFDDDSTLPALPHIPINVLIAPNEDFSSFTFNMDSLTSWNNINVKACEIPTLTNENPDTIFINSPLWNGIYSSNVEYTGSHIMDDYKMLSFVISPYSYNGSTGELTLSQSVNISINLDTITHNQINSPYLIKPGINMPELIETSVINHDEMTLLYGEPMAALETPINIDYYPYLIITRDSCRTAFEPLVRWKTIKGKRAKILTVEEIDSTFDGSTLPLRIKTALRYYRNRHFTKYVLLGGDENIVPTQLCNIWVIYKKAKLSRNVAGDIFYACFGDMDWDTNGDGIAAQYPDSTGYGDKPDLDMYPSIVVTRIPAENNTHIASILNKIITYESSPNTNSWSNNVLLCGNMLYYKPLVNGRYKSDAESNGEILYNNYILPYWNCELTRFFDTYTDLPGCADYAFSPVNITEQFNKGFTFVHVDTHGGTNCWATESGGNFTNTHAANLSNSGNTIIATTSCNTNRFDETPRSLSQALLDNPYSGILAYFGSSREGWTTTSQYLDQKFFKSILTLPDHRFGEAAKNAKFSQIAYNNGLNRWVYIAVNPMGDPEMPVFTALPQTRVNAKISFKNNNLHIKCDNDDYKACVTSIDDYGVSFFSIESSDNGEVVFSGVPDSCRVCITAPGYIPYFQTVFKDAYIQNETISDSKRIVTENLFIGTNVTETKPIGPVLIENGTELDVSFSNGVYIMPETDIEKGAIINIQSN